MLDYIALHLPYAALKVSLWRWAYEPGIPDDAPDTSSPLLTDIEGYARRQEIPSQEEFDDWGSQGQTYYLESLARPVPAEVLTSLEERFALARAANYDVRWAYLLACAESVYEAVLPAIKRLLSQVGRTKYVKSIFLALLAHQSTRDWAIVTFAEVRGDYHPMVRAVVGKLVAKAA